MEQELDAMPPEMSVLAAALKKLLAKGDHTRYRIETTHQVYDTHGKKVSEIKFDLERDESEGPKACCVCGSAEDALSTSIRPRY